MPSAVAAVPSLAKVEQVLGSYSIASIKNWLKSEGLPSSANSRVEIGQRVHKLIENGSLSFDSVIEALIGVEESASKLLHVYTVDVSTEALDAIANQIANTKTLLSTERTPAVNVTKTPKQVYVLDKPNELRAKWAEMQTHVSFDKKKRTWSESSEPRIILFTLDKMNGMAQIRYDKPLDLHSHESKGAGATQAYFDFYREKIENLIGVTLDPSDLRPGLRKVLLTDPPIVIPKSVDHIGGDGGTTKSGHRKRGADPRKSDDWIQMHAAKKPRTYEVATLRWLTDPSKGQLKREVVCTVDAPEGTIRFDADCHEGEISYVLAHLL